MSQNLRFRIVRFQLAEQIQQRTFLGIRTGVRYAAVLIQPAFVTDADAFIVPTGGVGAYLMYRATRVCFSVAGDIEVVTDVGKSSGLHVTLIRENPCCTG